MKNIDLKKEIRFILENDDPINNALKKAMGFKKSTGENKMGLSLEKLPKGKSIFLPSLRSLEGDEEIKDQEGATQWENEFMATYKLDPGHDKVRFKPAPGGRWEVSNSKEFNAAIAKTNAAVEKWMKDNK